MNSVNFSNYCFDVLNCIKDEVDSLNNDLVNVIIKDGVDDNEEYFSIINSFRESMYEKVKDFSKNRDLFLKERITNIDNTR